VARDRLLILFNSLVFVTSGVWAVGWGVVAIANAVISWAQGDLRQLAFASVATFLAAVGVGLMFVSWWTMEGLRGRFFEQQHGFEVTIQRDGEKGALETNKRRE
jgi:hypothetical protein